MSDIVHCLPHALVPVAQPGVIIRMAEPRDEGFIDHCQKLFAGHLGFLYAGVIAKKIAKQEVLVATDATGAWVGYCMGSTGYDRNDAVSRIDQIAVVPFCQRKQIAGSLLTEWINRLPYGVRLICCWCAQDLKENRFWEQMGFIPLAFRAGGMGQRRVHIFWQRRTRKGDTETDFWYPKETSNGAMAAARIILPIPAGADWRTVELPRILPNDQRSAALDGPVTPAMLTARAASRKMLPGKVENSKPLTVAEYSRRLRERNANLRSKLPVSAAIVGRVQTTEIVRAQTPAAKTPRPKNDPMVVGLAREVRDRYLEGLNARGVVESGKYDPARVVSESANPASQLAEKFLAGVQITHADRALPD